MTRPESLYEAASYDLNQFRERRMAERRATPRATGDRRQNARQSEVDMTQAKNTSNQEKH